jgi:hypothetical protein
MLDSAVLQVLVGLALVFAVFSVAVSRLNEAVLGVLNYRARQLETELRRLTGSGQGSGVPGGARDVVAELFDGPMRGLRAGGRTDPPALADLDPARGWLGHVVRAHRLRLPAYLPSTAFARGVLDLVEPPARALLHQIRPQDMIAIMPTTVTTAQHDRYDQAYRAAYDALTPVTAAALHDAMPAGCEAGRAVTTAIVALLPAGQPTTLLPMGAEIAKLPASPLRTALTGIAARAGADRDKLLTELATWYDSSMDRLSGWYKRRIGRFLLVYAVVLTVAFNLDVIGLTQSLWQDSAVRAVAVAEAENRVQPGQSTAQGSGEGVVEAVRDIGALQLPFGWTRARGTSDLRDVPRGTEAWLLKILGWLIAVAGLAVGAPFWFDLLGRLVNMRATGPKPEPADG